MIRTQRRWTNALASFLLLGLALSNPVGAQAPTDSIDVLFVGNSYTYFNNLPHLIEAISIDLGGPVIRQRSHTFGGYTLREHLSDGKIPRLLREGGPTGDPFEFVALQEQSTLGVQYANEGSGELGSSGLFHSAVRELGQIIRESGATPLLYMTWAKESFPDQTRGLARAYMGIGAELEAPVAPVGVAWARVREERPELKLFVNDGSHPNPAGSYLAACVFYAQVTGRSPGGAPADIWGFPWDHTGPLPPEGWVELVSLPPEVARYLQEVAWEVVRSSDRSGS